MAAGLLGRWDRRSHYLLTVPCHRAVPGNLRAKLVGVQPVNFKFLGKPLHQLIESDAGGIFHRAGVAHCHDEFPALYAGRANTLAFDQVNGQGSDGWYLRVGRSSANNRPDLEEAASSLTP